MSTTLLHPSTKRDPATTPADNASRPVSRKRAGWMSWPRLALVTSAVLLAVSNLFPYWEMRLNAPQYPGGLFLTLFTHDLKGDVSEIDGLNHYIGMMPLGDAAGFERSVAMFAMAAFVVMGILAGVLANRKWSWLALPIIIFPFAFLADMYYWLRYAGQNLDPTAALSGAVKPFTPTLLGHGVVGQFSTDAMVQTGFWIAAAAALLSLAGLVGRLRSGKAG
jgi:copper chaperone NosL